MDRQHSGFTSSIESRSKSLITRIDVTTLLCNLCGNSLDTLPLLFEHFRHRHKLDVALDAKLNLLPIKFKDGQLVCATCGSKFVTHFELSKHLQLHAFGLYVCHTCGKKFLSNGALEVHMKIHLPTFTCKCCKRQFVTNDEKIQHIRETKECQPFVCKICDERFLFWELKDRHMVKIHKWQKTMFPCKGCGKIFDARMKLYRHFKKTLCR